MATGSAPIVWHPPSTFDPEVSGLGFPQLEGISHRVIFDPAPSKANVDEGGDGKYESLLHGNYCHGPNYVIVGDYIIGRWSNHTKDEGGPGTRAIARLGRFVDDGDEIDWGGPETLVELAPPPIPPRRRYFDVDPVNLWPYTGAGILLINGTLYATGSIHSVLGYTDEERFRATKGPIPTENFRDTLDVDAGFFLDKWAPNGLEWVQQWKIDKGRLLPDSPMYQITPYEPRFEVTPGRFKIACPLQPPYCCLRRFEEAPGKMRADILSTREKAAAPRPKFKANAPWLAADGRHALAHSAEFTRPDGKIVILRDNLLNAGHFYAAIRENENDVYPPAIETNLIGGANISAGTLPDGRNYVIGNNYDDYYRAPDKSRKDMYITLSRDGINFDQTFLILHLDRKGDGGIYKYGGPQYYHPVIHGKNMWVFYSITKMKIGLTKIPLSVLG
jgi:hypothetical protein